MISDINEKELNALISLLDDPDQIVYEKVSRQIFSFGMNAVPFLENAWMQHPDQVAMGRIEYIIHHIQYDNIIEDLSIWREIESHDLLKGISIISKYKYPDLDEKKVTVQLGRIIQDIWLEMNKGLTPLDKVKVINHILFGVHKFENNHEKPWEDSNVFINSLFDTKKGNALSLSILYILVAQSLKIPVYGVDLPHHFILAYLTSMNFKQLTDVSEPDVLFYINSSNKGLVFPAKDIEIYLKQSKIERKPQYFLPCDNITIIQQTLVFLESVYKNNNESEKVLEVQYLIKVLAGEETN